MNLGNCFKVVFENLRRMINLGSYWPWSLIALRCQWGVDRHIAIEEGQHARADKDNRDAHCDYHMVGDKGAERRLKAHAAKHTYPHAQIQRCSVKTDIVSEACLEFRGFEECKNHKPEIKGIKTCKANYLANKQSDSK